MDPQQTSSGRPLRTFASRVRDVLFRHDDAVLRELLRSTGEEEVTQIIDASPASDKRRIFRMIAPDRQARLLVRASSYSQQAVRKGLSIGELKTMIDAAESDDAVDAIQLLEGGERARVIDELRKNDPHGLLPLLVFGEETAGGLMKTELLRFRSTLSVDDARRALAKEPVGRLRSHHLYVVDDRDALLGTLSLMKLLQVPSDATLAHVMNPPAAAIPATTDQEEVVKIFDEQNAIELPVVGHKGRLLGCITADDVFEVMEEEYSEDVSRLTGVAEDEHVSDPVRLKVRRRFPWLVVNLGTAVLAASVVSLFQDTIQRTVVLAAFMPVIAGMGGNAATQTLGVVVRAIALGEMHHLNTVRAVGKEIVAGAINGFLNGAIMAVVAYLWTGNATLSFVILVAMTANLFVAGFGGAAVPVIMRSLKIDPALASTVFVTTMTDICGFFVFLGLSSVLL